MQLAALMWLMLNAMAGIGGAAVDCRERIIAYDGEDLSAEAEIRLDIGPARLHLLGARHSREPEDPQHARIEASFAAIQPDVAFYEGPDRGIRPTREQTIAETGEAGLVRFLANERGVTVRRLEPDPRDELNFVLEKFPIDQAALFYLMRSAAQWREREGLSDEEIDARMSVFLYRVNELFASLPAPHNEFRVTSPSQIDAMAGKYWPGLDWRQAPMDWFTPERTGAETGGGFTNAVNMRSSHYRDVAMFTAIAQELVAGRTVFGVVGGDHLPRQRPAFECLAKARSH